MILLLKKKFFFILLLLVFAGINPLSSQNGFYVSKGFSVSFFFNTMSKINTGIEYLDFGEIMVFNDGTEPGGASWRLQVYADAFFDNGMPLEVVEIWADPGANGTSTGYQPLSNAPVILINGGAANGITGMPVNISYKVGATAPNTVSGYPSGYYRVNLVFEIIYTP